MNPGRSADLTGLVTTVLRHAPEWVRHDLAARERTARVRAEDTLAAMVVAALEDGAPLARRANPPLGSDVSPGRPKP